MFFGLTLTEWISLFVLGALLVLILEAYFRVVTLPRVYSERADADARRFKKIEEYGFTVYSAGKYGWVVFRGQTDEGYSKAVHGSDLREILDSIEI